MLWISPVRMLMNKGDYSHLLINDVQISSSLSLYLSSLLSLCSTSFIVLSQVFIRAVDHLHVLLCALGSQACYF